MEEIDIQEIFKRLWNSRRFILTTMIIFMIVAGVYSFVIQMPKYQSYTTIVLTKAGNTNDDAKPSEAKQDHPRVCGEYIGT